MLGSLAIGRQHKSVCVCAYVCTHTHMCAYLCMYIHMYIYTNTYIHSVFIHLCMHTYLYILTHIHIHSHTYDTRFTGGIDNVSYVTDSFPRTNTQEVILAKISTNIFSKMSL